jgi:hypothetical protein
MAKKSVLIPLIFALLAAAFWAGTSYRRAVSPADGDLAVVLVARYDLPANTVLKEEMAETRTMPRVYTQQDATEVRSMTDVQLVNGLVTLVRIPKGNQITRSCVAGASRKTSADAGSSPSQRRYLEGVRYFQNGNYEKAGEEWKASVKLDPSNAEAAAGLKRIKQILAAGK